MLIVMRARMHTHTQTHQMTQSIHVSNSAKDKKRVGLSIHGGLHTS